MRRLWLKFQLWRSGQCTIHLCTKKYNISLDHAEITFCPQCRHDDYERWQHRLRLMREEYQELDANR